MRYRCEYKYHKPWGNPSHVYTVIGARGAIHFHVSDMGEKQVKEYNLDQRFSGGLECHYRTPPDYMAHSAPSQDKCWLLCCPCWHDGTSLYASEIIIPFWLGNPNDHERMFNFLIREYEDRFNPKDEAA
jgi:hypothetical protein